MKNTGLNRIPPVKGYILPLSINLIFVAIVYIFVGAATSYGLSMLFPAYTDEWKSWSLPAKLADVSAEISVIVIIAFWLTYVVNSWIPILPLPPRLEYYIESFGGQVVFLYAVFVFLETLDDKLIEVFREIFPGGK